MPKSSPHAKTATATATAKAPSARGRTKTAVSDSQKSKPRQDARRTKAAAKDTVRVPDVDAQQQVDELRALWNEFKDSRSAEARERLILHYAPLVKYVASRDQHLQVLADHPFGHAELTRRRAIGQRLPIVTP